MRRVNERERTIWQFVIVKSNVFRHNIVKVVNFDNVMTKYMINNRTDAWKNDVNLLFLSVRLRGNKIHFIFVCYFRCFSAWHALASTRVSNRRKVLLFEERRLLTMVSRIVNCCKVCAATGIYCINCIMNHIWCVLDSSWGTWLGLLSPGWAR